MKIVTHYHPPTHKKLLKISSLQMLKLAAQYQGIALARLMAASAAWPNALTIATAWALIWMTTLSSLQLANIYHVLSPITSCLGYYWLSPHHIMPWILLVVSPSHHALDTIGCLPITSCLGYYWLSPHHIMPWILLVASLSHHALDTIGCLPITSCLGYYWLSPHHIMPWILLVVSPSHHALDTIGLE